MSEKALSLNDKNYDVWNNLVICYDWLKLPEKSAEARGRLLVLLEQAIKTNPQDANAHATLAAEYAVMHEKEKTLSHVQTTLALTPDDPINLLSVADAYELMGDRRQAVVYIERALKHGLKADEVRGDPYMQSILKDPALKSSLKR